MTTSHTQTHRRRHQKVDSRVTCSHVMTVSAPIWKKPLIICIMCLWWCLITWWHYLYLMYYFYSNSQCVRLQSLMLNLQYRKSIAAGSCTFSDTFLETLLKECVCVSSVMTNQNTRYLCSCRNVGTFCLCNTIMMWKPAEGGGSLTIWKRRHTDEESPSTAPYTWHGRNSSRRMLNPSCSDGG